MTVPELPEDNDPTSEVRPPDRIGQVAAIIGKVLIGAGVFVLLFALFQIFGTAIIQQRHQDSLRSQFEKQLKTVSPTTLAPNSGPPVTIGNVSVPSVGSPIAIMEIPAIGVNQVIVQGTNDAQLQIGPGHYLQTPLPGQGGNVAIAGHRTTWGRPFYNLNELKLGNRIILSSVDGTFTYAVNRTFIVSPSDVGVLSPTPDATLTLTTCNPRFSAAQRLVVQAKLVNSATSTSTASSTHAPVSTPPKQPAQSQSWLASILLGILTAALLGATLFFAPRVRRRWLVYLGGGLVTFVALMFFFGAISQLLPAGI